MTARVATPRAAIVRVIASELVRGGALIAIAMLLVLGLLPAALGAAGPPLANAG